MADKNKKSGGVSLEAALSDEKPGMEKTGSQLGQLNPLTEPIKAVAGMAGLGDALEKTGIPAFNSKVEKASAGEAIMNAGKTAGADDAAKSFIPGSGGGIPGMGGSKGGMPGMDVLSGGKSGGMPGMDALSGGKGGGMPGMDMLSGGKGGPDPSSMMKGLGGEGGKPSIPGMDALSGGKGGGMPGLDALSGGKGGGMPGMDMLSGGKGGPDPSSMMKGLGGEGGKPSIPGMDAFSGGKGGGMPGMDALSGGKGGGMPDPATLLAKGPQAITPNADSKMGGLSSPGGKIDFGIKPSGPKPTGGGEKPDPEDKKSPKMGM